MGNDMMQSAVILAAVLAGLIASMSLAATDRTAPKERQKVVIDAKKIKGPKRNGKGGREFPVMFDIAGKAQTHKTKKGIRDK